MKVIECKGNHRRIGQITGEALREDIRCNLDMVKKPDTREWARRLPCFLDTLKKYLPHVHEEMQGTAEGADVLLDDIYRLNLPMYPNELCIEEGCTNIVFANGPDGPIWGKNNDGLEADIKKRIHVCARVVKPAHGIPIVTFTFCGMIATMDSMNSEGLATGHSSVGSVFQQSDHYVPIRLWAYDGMMKCRTTNDFVRHMTAIPLRGKGYSIVCVDRQGVMCSIEAPCPVVQVRLSANPNGMNCVNCYQLPMLKDSDRRSPEGKQNALARLRYLDNALEQQDTFDVKLMKKLLSHHGTPSICRHGKADLSYTEYSMIGLPRENRILYLHGYPCENEYSGVQL